jgi:hypothetical protein
VNGKFCTVTVLATKQTHDVFIFAVERSQDKRPGSFTVYHGLEIPPPSDEGSLHLDHVIHYVTGEALNGNVSMETLQECALEAVYDLGGEFDITKYVRSFLAPDIIIRVDSSKEDYWQVEEESSYEEEYGSY